MFITLRKLVRSRRAAYILGVAGLLLVAAAILALMTGHRTATQPPGTDQARPSAIRPSDRAVASYTVAADRPKYITIPAIKVPTTRVMELGLTSGNKIAAPRNVYDAGWYGRSAKPGQPGAMFIYGHVSSRQATGVFYDLKKLRPGNLVTVTDGAGRSFVYKVINTKTYPYDAVDMRKVLSPVGSQPGLNLMTCTGPLIQGTSAFSERLVVFTTLVKS